MRASTAASTNQMVHGDEDDDEDSYQMPINIAPNDYMTTTLVYQRNITLADVVLQVFNKVEFDYLERNLMMTLNNL